MHRRLATCHTILRGAIAASVAASVGVAVVVVVVVKDSVVAHCIELERGLADWEQSEGELQHTDARGRVFACTHSLKATPLRSLNSTIALNI